MFAPKKIIGSASVLGVIVLALSNSALAATPGRYHVSNPGSVQCTTTNDKIHVCTNQNPFLNASYAVTKDGDNIVINNLNGLTQSIVVPLNTQDVFCTRLDGSLLPSCTLGFSDMKYTITASANQQNTVVFNQLSVESHYTGMIPAILNGDIKTAVTGMTLAPQS